MPSGQIDFPHQGLQFDEHVLRKFQTRCEIPPNSTHSLAQNIPAFSGTDGAQICIEGGNHEGTYWL